MQSSLLRNFGKLNNLNSFFCNYLHNSSPLSASPRTTKGARRLKKARKYRPADICEASTSYTGIGPHVKVQSFTDSLRDRGFCKERNSYTPPSDVEKRIFQIAENAQDQQLTQEWKSMPLLNSDLKFKLLTQCIDAFGHDIPSSLLCRFKHMGDVVDYFSTQVDGMSPYETLIREGDNLPPNLHIIAKPSVFDPDTDKFFDGVTAFPGRKRLIHTKRGQEFEKIVEWPNV